MKTKLLLYSMRDEGLIDVIERKGENGARLENAYRLTRKGCKRLAALASHEEEPEGN